MEHFFLLFHAYDTDRRDLLSVDALLRPHGLENLPNKDLLKIVLYGHEKLSFDFKTKVLEATLKVMCPYKRTAYTQLVKLSIKTTACDWLVFSRCKTAHMKR